MRNHSPGIIVLAGGTGQINGESKTTLKLGGLTMPQRLLATLRPLQWPTVVVINGVGQVREQLKADLRKKALNLHFVNQPWRLGTADAFSRGAQALQSLGNSEAVVLHADMPCWSLATVQQVAESHQDTQAVMTFGAIRSQRLPEPWPLCFRNYGRIYEQDGRQLEIVEARHVQDLSLDGSFALNTGLYCFNIQWALDSLWKLSPRRQGEYYLPELLLVANEQRAKVNFFPVPWWEAMAANNREELEQMVHREEWR